MAYLFTNHFFPAMKVFLLISLIFTLTISKAQIGQTLYYAGQDSTEAYADMFLLPDSSILVGGVHNGMIRISKLDYNFDTLWTKYPAQ